MQKKKWKNYAFYILITEAVGLLGGILIREGTQIYSESVKKPPLSPPAILFPIVWTLLYALMGISVARISLLEASKYTKQAKYLYFVQLAFNFCWGIIFFRLQAFGAALGWLLVLWALILAMIIKFKRLDPVAGYLQIPYLLWVSFAGYLNAAVWLLNA